MASTDKHLDVTGRIAQEIAARADVQGWKGKRGDAAALEATAGALAACIAILGNDDDRTKALMMFAYLTSIRGLAHVRERAATYAADLTNAEG